MPFVLDASIAAAWAFRDEDHGDAASALALIRTNEAHVPSLWWFEVRNTLIVSERRRRLTEADTAAFLRELSRLAIVVDRAPEEQAVLALARHHRLTVYDAAYLELARRERLPLATLDTALASAARKEKVSLIGELR
jgi:predicted nucleic acid-binding protein